MSTKPSSRWANTKDDDALEAKIKQDKEEKKRRKAEKGRRIKEEQAALEASQQQANGDQQQQQDLEHRPAKRRRLSAGRDGGASAVEEKNNTSAKTLRFDGGTWGRSRSVETYDKLNDIEEGTYGWVARATQRATGKVVALKRLKLEPGDRNGLPVTGLREIQILRECRHRNIVAMEEVVVGEQTTKPDNSIFIVLEFVEHDLKGILEDMPEPFLSSEIKQLLLQLTSGVAYLHDNWILHRDLKTSNLLLNNRGQLKIADFGMARYVGDPPPRLTALVVTLWYRGPELLLGAREYGRAVDMWSVGCIFGELVTREPLLQGRNEVDQLSKIFELCGLPSEDSWPGFRKLPNARTLRLPPKSSSAASTSAIIRSQFPGMTSAGASLLADLLALDPERRPTANEVLRHEYFRQDPKPKPESMFPTFPSKAGQERRRRHEPNAPVRGQAAAIDGADFSTLFQNRDKEERGAGFTLRMV